MYNQYNSAKKALSKGTVACQQANDLAAQTKEKLIQAAKLTQQVQYLQTSLPGQVSLLHQIADQIQQEEDQYQLDFHDTIHELDTLDDELNEALTQLKMTNLPAALSTSNGDTDTKEQGTSNSTKSLFTFADDAAVENLKGQLRQVVDDMQDSIEACSTVNTSYGRTVAECDRMLGALPVMPVLQAPRDPKSSDSRQATMSLSMSSETYIKQQGDHLEQMAELLLSLSQHYDHSCTLLKADASLTPEELEELQSVVLHDAEQLEDVLGELEGRLAEIEEDIDIVKEYMKSCSRALASSLEMFYRIEAVKVDALETSLVNIRQGRIEAANRLDILKRQMIGLSDHYKAFCMSYHALLVEVDRRSKYETSVAAFIEETSLTLEALAVSENEKREQFKHNHGETLPENIWSGITAKPALHDLRSLRVPSETPRLPRDLVAAAKQKLLKER